MNEEINMEDNNQLDSKKEDYTFIANSILDDERLTSDCKLVILYFLRNKNHNKLRIMSLQPMIGFGRVRMKRALKDLTGIGYILRRLIRAPNGKIIDNEIYLNPSYFP